MYNIFKWTGCLQLTGECRVLGGSLGGLNLLPHGCVLRSMEGRVISVGYEVIQEVELYVCNGERMFPR
jgi:hypothetical protein